MGGDTAVSSRFWPATFQERGVSIPFTTPSIAFSRVRSDGREGLEVLVPGLSGGQGVYVIPWRGLRDMFKMSVHDRALHEEIDGLKDADPARIREIVLNVAMTGLAGPAAAAAARGALGQDDDDRLLASFHLIAAVIRGITGTELKLSLAELATEAGQREVRGTLNRIADKLGMPAMSLHERMDAWAALISAIGVSAMKSKCRIGRLVNRIETFSDTVGIWGDQSFTENRELGHMICNVSFETLAVTRAYLTTLDKFTEAAGDTLTNWERASPSVHALAQKTEWLLDGWGSLVGLWDAGINEPAHELDTIVGTIFRLLPLVPRDELDARRRERWASFEKAINMSQRNNDRKGSATIDLDGMLRLEKTKSKAL